MLRVAILTAMLASSALVGAVDGIPMIPVVAASKAKAHLVPPPDFVKKKTISAQTARVAAQDAVDIDRSQLVMTAGVNEIVQVAVSHLNRIVTPYKNPVVTTSSQVTTEVRDNVIYIGTTNESPITLFVTESGSEDQALSLTLIPKKIPPREIFLHGPAGNGGTQRVNEEAEKWETAQPYLLTLQSVFHKLALGELPGGYAFQRTATGDLPTCRQTGIRFNFTNGQTVIGHHLVVHIGVAENVSTTTVEFIEDTCGAWDVAAVSAFPRNALSPGEKTEIYVAKKKQYRKDIAVERPSLLSGGVLR